MTSEERLAILAAHGNMPSVTTSSIRDGSIALAICRELEWSKRVSSDNKEACPICFGLRPSEANTRQPNHGFAVGHTDGCRMGKLIGEKP